MELTENEVKQIEKLAIQGARIDEIEKYVPEIFASLKSINKTVTEVPLNILRCRNEVDKEIKAYMHDKFITDTDLTALETKLEKRVQEEVDQVTDQVQSVGKLVNRATWVITGAVLSGSVIFGAIMYIISIASKVSGL